MWYRVVWHIATSIFQEPAASIVRLKDWVTILPWRWRLEVPPNCSYIPCNLHSFTTHLCSLCCFNCWLLHIVLNS